MGTGYFPGVKRPCCGLHHEPPSSAEVKERVAIPLLRLWAFVACSRVNLTFTFTFHCQLRAPILWLQYSCMFGCNWYMIYLLTAIGLTPGGSSTVHNHTQTIHRTTQTIHRTTKLIWKSEGCAPSLRGIPWHLPYNWGKNTGEKKTSVRQSSRRVPVGTMKTGYTEQNIHTNKNT